MTTSDNNENDTKLILHVDIRNTIFAADSVGDLKVEQGVNSYITGVVWGNVDENTLEWKPVSNLPSLKPPCSNVVTYYKYLEKLKNTRTIKDRLQLRIETGNFVNEKQGTLFQPIFQKCLQRLKWNNLENPSITAKGMDGTLYHYIFKSFLNLLKHLRGENRDFAIILRTFGVDAKGTLQALKSTIQGFHPEFPEGMEGIKIDEKIYNFRRQKEKGGQEKMRIVYEGNSLCNGELEILQWMADCEGIVAIKDDFEHWRKHNYSQFAGKPFWINKQPQQNAKGKQCVHFIFDDNIRTWESDSIVNFREMSRGVFRDVLSEEVKAYEHLSYEQADLIDAICDPNYYVKLLSTCENNTKLFYNNII